MRLITALILVLIVNTLQAQKYDLDFYITKAKAFSPLINQAQNENKIVGLNLELIKSILSKPEINIDANVLFAPIISHDNNTYKFEVVSNGATNYAGYDLAISNGGQYQSVVSLKQPLFSSSSLKTYSYKADIARQLNDNRILLTSHELEKVISHQFILCLKAKKSADISLELLKEFEDRILVMQKLVESAIFKVSDLMLMQIELDNYKLDYETYRSDFRNNVSDLNVLCGIKDTTMVELQELDLQLSSSNNNSSSFLTSYRLDSLNINADQSITDLKYKPQINLFANAGLNAVYLPAFNRFGISTGLTFSWNIFDGYQQKIQKQKTGINLLTLDFEKHTFITQQDIYKKSVLNQLAFLEKKIQLIDNQIVKYDQLLKAYRSQLSQGDISVMDFKNTERDFVSKKMERAMLNLEKQSLIISYNYWNY
jgi:hypothetical protein